MCGIPQSMDSALRLCSEQLYEFNKKEWIFQFFKEKLLNLSEINKIKRLSIVAMVQDDELLETLVLKGGNALDIIYNISSRGSMDLDFSIEHEFKPGEISSVRDRIFDALKKVFNEHGYTVFDIDFFEKPSSNDPKIPDFWGGYGIEFKIIPTAQYAAMADNVENLRRNATVVGSGQQKKFIIDISKFEYCEQKKQVEVDNYAVYVYSPEMIVFEKLRAICQQMEEYTKIFGKSHISGRARDFFDIYTVLEHFSISLTSPNQLELLKKVFAAKRVPLKLLGCIPKYRELHKSDFPSVESTVRKGVKLNSFDYYFDYVVDKSSCLLKALGIK